MGLCKDYTLFCDVCNGSDILGETVAEVRRIAKTKGWKRRRNKEGKMQDMCGTCVDVIGK